MDIQVNVKFVDGKKTLNVSGKIETANGRPIDSYTFALCADTAAGIKRIKDAFKGTSVPTAIERAYDTAAVGTESSDDYLDSIDDSFAHSIVNWLRKFSTVTTSVTMNVVL